MPQIPVTLLYGSLTALLLAALGMNVSRMRGEKKASMTTPPDADLLRVIRAHGNCSEWAPIMLFMLLLLELSGAPGQKLHILGGGIFLGRALHAAGVLSKTKIGIIGMSLTYLLSFGMPIYGLMLHFR
jgi:hypothetical protein